MIIDYSTVTSNAECLEWTHSSKPFAAILPSVPSVVPSLPQTWPSVERKQRGVGDNHLFVLDLFFSLILPVILLLPICVGLFSCGLTSSPTPGPPSLQGPPFFSLRRWRHGPYRLALESHRDRLPVLPCFLPSDLSCTLLLGSDLALTMLLACLKTAMCHHYLRGQA